MKSKIITLVLFLAVMAGGYIWWIWPLVYHIPGATLTIIDEDTGKSIEGILVEIGWHARGWEGRLIKHEWAETKADGKLEVAAQTFNLWGDDFTGLMVELSHPLYKSNTWLLKPDRYNSTSTRNAQIAFTKIDPSRRVEIIKMKSYKKLLENFDGCNWDPENRKAQPETTPLNLIGDFSFYASRLYRSQFPKNLDIQRIENELIRIIAHVFRSCPDKKEKFIKRLNSVEI